MYNLSELVARFINILRAIPIAPGGGVTSTIPMNGLPCPENNYGFDNHLDFHKNEF